MKKIATILFATILLGACTVDAPDDDIVNVDLEGSWVLENVVCFCFFEPGTDFSTGRIQFQGSKLSVTNEAGESYMIKNGDYEYTVDGNLITLSNDEQYRYQREVDKLYISNIDDPRIADDEITLVFYKR